MNFFEWLGLSKFIKDTEPTNVIKFPELKTTPPMPYVVPPVPAPEPPAKIFYKIGTTDTNRLSLWVCGAEIVMTKGAVEKLIAQLELVKDQLYDEPEET